MSEDAGGPSNVKAAAENFERVKTAIRRPPELRSSFDNSVLLRFCEVNDFFSQLSYEQQVALVKVMGIHVAKSGEILIQQNSPIDDSALFYLIVNGSVGIFLQAEDSSKTERHGQLVATLGPGETFGDTAMRAKPGSVRSATCVAMSESNIIYIDKASFLRVFKDKVNFLISPIHCTRILAKDPADRTIADQHFLANIMHRFEVFQRIPQSALLELCRNLTLKKFDHSTVIRRQDGPLSPEFGVILKGSIAVHIKDTQDDSQFIDIDQRYRHLSPNVQKAIKLLRSHSFKIGASALGRQHSRTGELLRIVSLRGLNKAMAVAYGSAVCYLKPGDTVGEGALTADLISIGARAAEVDPALLTYSRGGVAMCLTGTETATLRAMVDVEVATLSRWKFEEIMRAQELFISPNSAQAKLAFSTPPFARTSQHVGVIKTVCGSFPFFSSAPTYVRDQLCKKFIRVSVKRGDPIFIQHTHARYFYLILEGTVSCHYQSDSEKVAAISSLERVDTGKFSSEKPTNGWRQQLGLSRGLTIGMMAKSFRSSAGRRSPSRSARASSRAVRSGVPGEDSPFEDPEGVILVQEEGSDSEDETGPGGLGEDSVMGDEVYQAEQRQRNRLEAENIQDVLGPLHGILSAGDTFGSTELIRKSEAKAVSDSQKAKALDRKTRALKTKLVSTGLSSVAVPKDDEASTDDTNTEEKTEEDDAAAAGDDDEDLDVIDASRRSYTAVARTNCQLLLLSEEDILQLNAACPNTLLLQGNAAMHVLRQSPSTRTPLQLEWLADFLHKTRFLLQLPRESVNAIARSITVKTCAKGELVVKQGTTGSEFYVVLHGRFKVYRKQDADREEDTEEDTKEEVSLIHPELDLGQDLATLDEGDSFGEQAIQSAEGGTKRNASIVCVQHGAELAVISAAEYRRHLTAHASKLCFVPKHAISIFQKPVSDRTPEDEAHIFSLVGRLQFFRQLPKNKVRVVCSALQYTALPAGHLVCSQGEVGTKFYIILKGVAGVYVKKMEKSGDAGGASGVPRSRRGALRRLSCVEGDDLIGKLVARLGPGDSFGENALHEHVRRNATVGCMTDIELLVLTKDDYLEIFSDMVDTIEFRPQLLHQRLTSQEVGSSRSEMTYALVKGLPGFCELSRKALWSLVMQTSYQTYEQGKVIYCWGEPTQSFYMILSGSVKVMYEDRHVATLTDRECFGEAEINIGSRRRMMSIVTSEPSRVVSIPMHDYINLWPNYQEHASNIRMLRALPGFSKSPTKIVCLLYYILRPRTYSRGAVITREGAHAPTISIIREGSCTASKRTPIPYKAETDRPLRQRRLTDPPLPTLQSLRGSRGRAAQRRLRTGLHHAIREVSLKKEGASGFATLVRSASHESSTFPSEPAAGSSSKNLLSLSPDQAPSRKVSVGMAMRMMKATSTSSPSKATGDEPDAVDPTLEPTTRAEDDRALHYPAGQEFIDVNIVELSTLSTFGGVSPAPYTITVSSRSCTVLNLRVGAFAAELAGPLKVLTDSPAVYRSERSEEWVKQLEGSIAQPEYSRAVPKRRQDDPPNLRLAPPSVLLASGSPHTCAAVPNRTLTSVAGPLSQVLARQEPLSVRAQRRLEARATALREMAARHGPPHDSEDQSALSASVSFGESVLASPAPVSTRYALNSSPVVAVRPLMPSLAGADVGSVVEHTRAPTGYSLPPGMQRGGGESGTGVTPLGSTNATFFLTEAAAGDVPPRELFHSSLSQPHPEDCEGSSDGEQGGHDRGYDSASTADSGCDDERIKTPSTPAPLTSQVSSAHVFGASDTELEDKWSNVDTNFDAPLSSGSLHGVPPTSPMKRVAGGGGEGSVATTVGVDSAADRLSPSSPLAPAPAPAPAPGTCSSTEGPETRFSTSPTTRLADVPTSPAVLEPPKDLVGSLLTDNEPPMFEVNTQEYMSATAPIPYSARSPGDPGFRSPPLGSPSPSSRSRRPQSSPTRRSRQPPLSQSSAPRGNPSQMSNQTKAVYVIRSARQSSRQAPTGAASTAKLARMRNSHGSSLEAAMSQRIFRRTSGNNAQRSMSKAEKMYHSLMTDQRSSPARDSTRRRHSAINTSGRSSKTPTRTARASLGGTSGSRQRPATSPAHRTSPAPRHVPPSPQSTTMSHRPLASTPSSVYAAARSPIRPTTPAASVSASAVTPVQRYIHYDDSDFSVHDPGVVERVQAHSMMPRAL